MAVIDASDGAASARLGAQRANCLILAGAFDRAAAAVATASALNPSPQTRDALELLSARLALQTGQRARAHVLATALEGRRAPASGNPDPDPDLELGLATLWGQLGDPRRAWLLVERVTAALGEDLVASELWFRAAEVAGALARHPDAVRFAERATALAVQGSAGPDTLARYRCLATRVRARPNASRSVRC